MRLEKMMKKGTQQAISETLDNKVKLREGQHIDIESMEYNGFKHICDYAMDYEIWKGHERFVYLEKLDQNNRMVYKVFDEIK